MHTLTQQALSMKEAQARFQGVIDLQVPDFKVPKGTVPGVEVLLPSPTETDIEAISTLFIWLPRSEI